VRVGLGIILHGRELCCREFIISFMAADGIIVVGGGAEREGGRLIRRKEVLREIRLRRGCRGGLVGGEVVRVGACWGLGCPLAFVRWRRFCNAGEGTGFGFVCGTPLTEDVVEVRIIEWGWLAGWTARGGTNGTSS
jgi:hypothetical protein